MLWDATELRVVDLSSDDVDTRNHVLVAGADGDTSVLQPMWRSTKDGTNELYYVSDETGYYNIWRSVVGETTNVNVNVNVNVLPMSHDFGGSAPGWILGAPQGFRFASDGRLVATYGKDGHTRLVVADVPENGVAVNVQEYSGHPDDGHGLPRLFGDVVLSPANDNDDDDNDNDNHRQALYFLGGGPDVPTSAYRWNLDDPDAPAVRLASSSSLSLPDGVVSAPVEIEFPTSKKKNNNDDDETAFGYYYPPRNDRYAPSDADVGPPLLVKAHGGPTSCTSVAFNPSIQYWTSRGFAVLDVDYGGSTGHGREYRRRLRNAWGIVGERTCATTT